MNKKTMLKEIEKDIEKWLESMGEKEEVSIYMIYEKFYLDREDFTIGLPGYFNGWVPPMRSLLKKNGFRHGGNKKWIKETK